MPETMQRTNNAKSKIRARVEHVFAEQKHRMGLFIRTIGIAPATTKIGMTNLVHNIKRVIFPAQPRHRLTGLCYAKRPTRLNTIPNSNQAKSAAASADLLRTENSSLNY
jgi:hypothetical protein